MGLSGTCEMLFTMIWGFDIWLVKRARKVKKFFVPRAVSR